MRVTSLTPVGSCTVFGIIPEVSRPTAPGTVSDPLNLNNAHDIVHNLANDGVRFKDKGDGWGDGRHRHPIPPSRRRSESTASEEVNARGGYAP